MIRGHEVLLCKRAHDPWKDLWSLPGGVVETGELLQDAVRRELMEETGLDVEPLEVVEVFESIRPSEHGRTTFHFVVIDYLCSVRGGELQAGDDAHAVAWFDYRALPQDLTPGAARVIEKALAATPDNTPRDTLKM